MNPGVTQRVKELCSRAQTIYLDIHWLPFTGKESLTFWMTLHDGYILPVNLGNYTTYPIFGNSLQLPLFYLKILKDHVPETNVHLVRWLKAAKKACPTLALHTSVSLVLFKKAPSFQTGKRVRWMIEQTYLLIETARELWWTDSLFEHSVLYYEMSQNWHSHVQPNMPYWHAKDDVRKCFGSFTNVN